MFLITEVHPFTDGNGRIARALMNAELVAAGERRILIPTVFRDDYLGALRALSRYDAPMPFLLSTKPSGSPLRCGGRITQ